MSLRESKIEFIPGKVERLMEELERDGQLEPVTVRKDPRLDDYYYIEDGNNRIEAARRLGWKELKVRYA